MTCYIFGVIGQWTACIALAAGIAIEIHYQADIGFLSITIGSVLFALRPGYQGQSDRQREGNKKGERPGGEN